MVLTQNCEFSRPKAQSGAESEAAGNGSGYTGLRPKDGNYFAKIDKANCASPSSPNTEYFEVVTVKSDSNVAQVVDECAQVTRQVPVKDLDVKAYREDHVVMGGKIYEHEMSRSAEYYNEALCDFSDKGFGILIRWYEQYLFHVAHTFLVGEAYTTPILRYNDYDFGNGNFGTGYVGQDFALAVLDNYKMDENAFAGYYSGKLKGVPVEALGLCVTTTHSCVDLQLNVDSTGSTDNFAISSISGAAVAVSGTLHFAGEIGDLRLTVTADSKIYDCRGYVSKLNNHLTLGGCTDRPSNGQAPKKVMVQVRGEIKFSSPTKGTVNSKVCTEKKAASF